MLPPGKTTVQSLPVTPVPELEQWAAKLADVARQPLELCGNFPAIAARFEAWWAHDFVDRPIFIAAANKNPDRAITRRTDLVERPDAWFEAKMADMLQLHRVGDALPGLRVDFGPALLGGLFGGKMEFDAYTSWTHALIADDWSNTPDWTFSWDHPLWERLAALLDRVAADAPGRYLVVTPDLGGSADVLLNLRGGMELCTDTVDKPRQVKEAIDAIYPAWRQAFCALYARTVGRSGAGLIHWLNLWSHRPYLVPACDFSFMIGPREFAEICLPDIARQAATVRRAVFHLDGAGSARHIDALLEIPHLQAIQFTPGEGTPSVKPWITMFEKIQQAGRSLLVITPPNEVLELCRALPPEGLAILLDQTPVPDELDRLFADLCRQFGCGDQPPAAGRGAP